MIKKQHFLWVSLLLIFLTGCTSKEATEVHVPTSVTMVTTGDLGAISPYGKTFAWHPTMFSVHTANKLDDEELIRHMRQSITKIMDKKGYSLVSEAQSPSMVIGFGMALESEMSDKEIMDKAGLVAGLSTAGIDDEFEKGSVLVAIFIPNSQQPIWRVLAQGFTETDKPVQNREQRFDKLTTMMLRAIPHNDSY
ncbi:DUF4136 domain-containing protein [Shewanella sp. 10N.286.51.B2]|uniref:DUF4136 domain-containing protein n=1 Tax=unclassified Shewanella TaxID=196818 RepID=UPI0026E48ABB|nr:MULTISPECIES: DUF4136 domain-containing protein [unclassified Shewanella]MDO6620569.1 DUF4136 domain-containing protein [Shewanella sp. 6_MG-2023]MDO6776725.1 DUF4136 domain-containing protein [Shewanella sp. 3_MG-2023]